MKYVCVDMRWYPKSWPPSSLKWMLNFAHILVSFACFRYFLLFLFNVYDAKLSTDLLSKSIKVIKSEVSLHSSVGEKLENARRSPFSISDLTCFHMPVAWQEGQLVLRGFQRKLSEIKGNTAYNSLVTLMWLSFIKCKVEKVTIKIFNFSWELNIIGFFFY